MERALEARRPRIRIRRFLLPETRVGLLDLAALALEKPVDAGVLGAAQDHVDRLLRGAQFLEVADDADGVAVDGEVAAGLLLDDAAGLPLGADDAGRDLADAALVL